MITTPILEVLNTDYASGRPTFVDSLRYAERYVVRFKKLPHADFYPFARIARPEQISRNTNYDLLMELTLNFLDATLKQKPGAIQYMTALAESEKRFSTISSFRMELAEVAPPTEHEFLSWLRYGNMEQAQAAWRRFGKVIVSENNFFFVTLFLAKENQAHAFEVFEMYMSAFPSSTRNTMLYEHLTYTLTPKQPAQALEICQKWIEQFPDSPHAYRAIAEAYITGGKQSEAMQNLSTALEKAAGLDQSAHATQALIRELRKRLDEIGEN